MLQKGFTASWFVPLEQEVSVHDILKLFAQFLLQGVVAPNLLLQQCFQTLVQSKEECMFVFLKRESTVAVGILSSTKPLYSTREKELLQQLGQTGQSNIPLWTWTEEHHLLGPQMERQCLHVNGPCMGIWCYR